MLPVAADYPTPSLARILAGLILAGFAPGAVIGLLALAGGDLRNALGFGAFLSLFYGVAPALVLGLPAALLLGRRIRPSLGASVLAGAMVASLPILLLALTTGLGFLVVALAAAPLGALGGVIFWGVALRGLEGSL